jgi:hypothetical protein
MKIEVGEDDLSILQEGFVKRWDVIHQMELEAWCNQRNSHELLDKWTSSDAIKARQNMNEYRNLTNKRKVWINFRNRMQLNDDVKKTGRLMKEDWSEWARSVRLAMMCVELE